MDTLLRHRLRKIDGAPCCFALSLASRELAADEEGRQRSHKSRSDEAPVDGIIGHRLAVQHSPHQIPALCGINIGCLGVAARAGVNLVPSATKG